MGRSRFLSLRAAELLVVALVGGGLALGGAAVFGKLGEHSTTTIEQAAPAPLPTTATTQSSSNALTPEAVYRQDGPGVVQVTATSVSRSAFLPATQTSKSVGSGFVLDRAVEVVAARHTVLGEARDARLADGHDAARAALTGPAVLALPHATQLVRDGWRAIPLPIGGWILERDA